MICEYQISGHKYCGKPATRFFKVILPEEHWPSWRRIGVGPVTVHSYCENHCQLSYDDGLWKREEITENEAKALSFIGEMMED